MLTDIFGNIIRYFLAAKFKCEIAQAQ